MRAHVLLAAIVAMLAIFGGHAKAESLPGVHPLSPGAVFTFDDTMYQNSAGCTFLETNARREPVGDMAITVLEGRTLPLQADPSNVVNLTCIYGVLYLRSEGLAIKALLVIH